MKKLALLSLFAIFLSGCVIGGISPQKAEEISAKFIEILAPGAKINIKSVEKSAGGDFKITADANGQEVISFLSPDGTFFYPQGLNIAELTKQFEEFKKSQEAADTPVEENGEMVPVEGENEVENISDPSDKDLNAVEEKAKEETETPAE